MRFIAYSFGGDLVGAAKTNSTARNQLIDGATDNQAVKNAVKDSATDSANNTAKKSTKSQTVFNGQTIQKNDDIFDPNQVSSWKEKGKVVTGTNIERMESGRAPIGYDGKSVNLHHVDQTDTGGLIEISASEHQSRYSELHTNTGQLHHKLIEMNLIRGKNNIGQIEQMILNRGFSYEYRLRKNKKCH